MMAYHIHQRVASNGITFETVVYKGAFEVAVKRGRIKANNALIRRYEVRALFEGTKVIVHEPW